MYSEAGIKDYYSILGITRNATPAEIKKAFRDKAKVYHPDVSELPDAHRIFIELGEAYEVLKDPESKENYDYIISGKAERAAGYNRSEREHEYRKAQQRAKSEAESYAGISLEELISEVIGFAIDAGRTVLVGRKDKPSVGIFDFIKMGFLGLVLTICIVISFTGIGTVPGFIIGVIVAKSLTKNGRFIGIVPFIICTLITDILVLALIISAIP